MSERRQKRRLQTFEVEIDAHTLAAGRYTIAGRRERTPATSGEQALEIVVRASHRNAGVPPWKPCIRASLTRARIV